MPNYYELAPAYGRDYNCAKDVREDFLAGKDFNGDYQMHFQLCSVRDFKEGDVVNLRYKKLTQVAVLKLGSNDTRRAMLEGMRLGLSLEEILEMNEELRERTKEGVVKTIAETLPILDRNAPKDFMEFINDLDKDTNYAVAVFVFNKRYRPKRK